jgi:quinol monooxygenase YgiN
MPIIVVARLRLRDPSLLDEFFTHAVAMIEQAQKTDGNLRADALAEAHDVWWDVTAWQSRAQIEVFRNTEPHLGTVGRGTRCPHRFARAVVMAFSSFSRSFFFPRVLG